MIISIQALREDEKRRHQDEQAANTPGRFGKFPWQQEEEAQHGVLKFIRFVAQP